MKRRSAWSDSTHIEVLVRKPDGEVVPTIFLKMAIRKSWPSEWDEDTTKLLFDDDEEPTSIIEKYNGFCDRLFQTEVGWSELEYNTPYEEEET